MLRLASWSAAVLVWLFSLHPLHAGNALSPKKIEEGWIMLFDGETTFGWETSGEVSVWKGQLIVGGKDTARIATKVALPPGELAFRYAVRGEVRIEYMKQTTLPNMGSFGWWNEYRFACNVKDGGTSNSESFEGMFSGMGTGWFDQGGGKRCKPLVFEVPAGSLLNLESVYYRPVQTSPLFNGKNLTGWKVFAGEKYKSKFAVTKDGELSVKDGPGDLQTTSTYDDFILQLECKTLGKALNSGIFFRCLPDQYQQGYEAQIQNAYKDNDRTKPADFGTGAIYRRIPARKVVANDNEWFTMTVFAQGKHLATWVNGYQTVSWTDDRPADENPRKGSRTGKGHLSIQGHDPTTNLLFRNLRVQELPKQ